MRLQIMELRVRDLVSINGEFFLIFLNIQSALAFLLTVLMGPPLVSRDMSNNALPLYLCRPFSRAEYAIGKMSILVILMSAITWIPGLLLFLFQSYLEGASWFVDNMWIGRGILVASWTRILTLALLSVTLSAWVKWRIAASAGLFGLFIIPSVIGAIISELFATRWGNIINIGYLLQTITDSLFREYNTFDLDISRRFMIPAWSAWIALFVVYSLSLLLLARRIKAYEVVK